MAKQKYDFKITLKKFGIAAVQIVVVGLIAYLTDNQMMLAIIPLLEAVKNYVKHKDK